MTTPKFERWTEEQLNYENANPGKTAHIRAAYAHMDHLARVSYMWERYARAVFDEMMHTDMATLPALQNETDEARAALSKEGLL